MPRTRIRKPLHTCEVCGAPTGYAIVGNRILSQWDVERERSLDVPPVKWRCDNHLKYKLRSSSKVEVNRHEDLIYTMTCGHVYHMLFGQGNWGYSPSLLEKALASGDVSLEKRHHCYECVEYKQVRDE